MSHILLLGAGFSRNWGGWLASEAFEYLLGHPEISCSRQLLDLLWRNLPTGGFENALAEVQADYKRDSVANKKHLDAFQRAVTDMFDDMNKCFDVTGFEFEFQRFQERTVRTFLSRFDAIFTLNQDLLIEHQYIDPDLSLLSNGRWNGSELPGMRPLKNSDVENLSYWGRRKWVPEESSRFQVNDRLQPYFKLHGSSNWQEKEGDSMLIMGGNKVSGIVQSPVLSWYQEKFEEYLFQADARLMVIGYGFRDEHINKVVIRAVKNSNLKMFIIAPEGGNLARTVNPTHGAAIRARTDLEDAFQLGLIGASRRSLREIFGNDTVEFNKVNRFFEA